MKTLRCREVAKSFNGVQALSDLSLEFPAGITAIIGPNGAGKTTLLNILTGFSQPDSGKCYWGDQVISGLPPHRIARLGIGRTFQELRLISQMSVLDNLLTAFPNQRGERLLGALMRIGVRDGEELNREHAVKVLRMFGLENKSSELAGEISYGEQKLLSVACCLATGAHILLLDEPVAGVHPDIASRILGHLQELQQAGRTVVFIEHDLAAVQKVADFVILLDEGKAVAQGPPRQVFERPEILEAYFE